MHFANGREAEVGAFPHVQGVRHAPGGQMLRPSSALVRANAQWDRRIGPRVVPVALPRPEPVGAGLARRPAASVPQTLRPISIFRPVAQTARERFNEILSLFTPSARRLACADAAPRRSSRLPLDSAARSAAPQAIQPSTPSAPLAGRGLASL